MDFISQYILANSGTQVPLRFTRWSAVFLLGTVSGRRVFVDHLHFEHRPTVYLCFVGDPASGKTTAMNAASNMFRDVFPSESVGASVTTREKIVELMAKDDYMRCYTDETGVLIECRPNTFFINELENFLSHNPRGMVQFLTDVYDSKFFDSATLKHGLQPLINPCINLLACTVPEYITEVLRMRIMGRGFSRRLLFIYETEMPDPITFPIKTSEAYKAEEWCRSHLQKVQKVCGKMEWAPGAKDFFHRWNMGLPRKVVSIFQGYHSSKDVLAQKIAMSLALSEDEPKLLFTQPLLERAIAFLESNEENQDKLAVAVGRNELALPQARLLEYLEANDGMMPEKRWHRHASLDLNEMEYASVKRLLKETDQLHEHSIDNKGFREVIVMTHAKYLNLVANGGIIIK